MSEQGNLYFAPARPRRWRLSRTQLIRALVCVAYVLVAGQPAIKGGIGYIHVIFAALSPVLVFFVVKRPTLLLVWGAALLWTVGQVLVNHAHGLSVVASAAIMMTLVCLQLTGLLWLGEHLRLSPHAIIGLAVAGWVLLSVNLGSLSTENPWKFGLGEAVIPLVFVVVGGTRGWWRNAVALAVIAAISFACDSRSLLGFAFVAVVWPLLRARLPRGRGGLSLAGMAGVLALAYLVYPVLASNGMMGARAQEQQVQYQADHANWLMANRKEVPQLWYLTRANLPTGIGTYGPIDEASARAALGAVQRAAGPLTPEDKYYLLHDVETQGYHAHSQLLASTLYGGLIPLPFWLLAFVLLLRALVDTDAEPGPQQAAWTFLVVNVLWNSFFSPFDFTTSTSITAALLVSLLGSQPTDRA